ncbi:MAG TPA: hypothetical protein VH879_07710 [Gemmatimonadales bacterium]
MGVALALGCIAGQWWIVRRTEQRLRDQTDGALARHAAAYLAVVTPSLPGSGFDARRLVSAAHTVADASFWPGGFQMALGSTALLPDSLELLPLPDADAQALWRGAASVVARHARVRVVLVPFSAGPGESPSGWAAAWNTLPPLGPTAVLNGSTVLGIAGIAAVVLAVVRRRSPRLQHALPAGIGLLFLFALVLGASLYHLAGTATRTRLLTARRLIEIAATAIGVQQSRLREIAVGLEVREVGPPVQPSDDVIEERGPGGAVARVIALTPRSEGGLELRAVPLETRLDTLWIALLGWVGFGAVGLAVAADAAGLSVAEGLFHSSGTAASSARDGGPRGP